MTTDFRALSAELLAEIKSMWAQGSKGGEIHENDDLIYRAFDALAEPLPESPSLKAQALAILDDCSDCLDGSHENIIRRALEELPND